MMKNISIMIILSKDIRLTFIDFYFLMFLMYILQIFLVIYAVALFVFVEYNIWMPSKQSGLTVCKYYNCYVLSPASLINGGLRA